MIYFEQLINNIKQGNLNNFLKTVGGISVVCLGYQLMKESKSLFKIQRKLNNDFLEIQRLPKFLIQNNVHGEPKKVNSRYIKHINLFYNTIEKKIPHINLSLYNTNITKLKISEVKRLDSASASATYNIADNKISKLKNENNSVFNHELFHLSSSKLVGGHAFLGFSQADKNVPGTILGAGLDEGYTVLLDKRYFNTSVYCETYNILYVIAFLIEKIVSKTKTEQLYFEADLYGLVEELKKYNSYENIIRFLKNTDLILLLENSSNTLISKYYCQKALLQISEFIITTYTNKLNKLVDSKLVSKEDMWKKILMITDILDDTININYKKYQFTNVGKMYDIISKNLSIPVKELQYNRVVNKITYK